MKFFGYVIDLFYPHICMACDRKLLEYEHILCSFCEIELPQTDFHDLKDNPVEVLFWGRCNVDSASAYYRYLKHGNVQNLIHNFKYGGFEEIGNYIGKIYGSTLNKSERFSSADYIIPVPLHKKKEAQRGFNQSEVFAIGLATKMNAMVENDNLYRKVNTDSQTRKSRWERYKNVSEIFGVRNPDKLKNKHIIIVDDVITTGSTMEACVIRLSEIEGIKISLLAMASAAH